MSEERKGSLGAGIWIVGMIRLIGSILVLISSVLYLTNKENGTMMSFMKETSLTNQDVMISIGMSVLLIIAMILIFSRSKFGVYLYFGVAIVSIVYNIVVNKPTISMIAASLVLPLIMLLFIIKRKEVFGIGEGTER